jgi:8-oxo-dGTP diphosphatase
LAKKVRVTAAIIIRNNEVLIAQRPMADKLSHKWEFPGGKIETGESPEQCISRELFEELDIEALVYDYFCTVNYEYDYISIELIAFFVPWFSGKIKNNVHDATAWVKLADLNKIDFASADLLIVKELQKYLDRR